MSESAILQAAYAAEAQYLELLADLVTHESPTDDKAACDVLATRLADHMRASGLAVERHERQGVGDVLEGRARGAGGEKTLLLCHYDTVWPIGTLGAMPFVRSGDKVSGPGALDMKAGIANALTALRLVPELGLGLAGDVTLLLTSDEETGSHASCELIERLARDHDRVFVLEPGRDDGALKVGRKGVGGFRLQFRGRSAHAGNNPSDGASALRELAHMLVFIEDLSDDVAGTTVNVTVARAGFATNVIAEEAEAFVDFRVLKASEAERVTNAIHDYTPRDSRVTLTVTGGLNRPPLELTPANRALFERAQAVGNALGLEFDGGVVGGGSDGNFTSAIGVPTLDGLGSVGGGPHARHEHVRVRESLERVALVAGLLVGSSASD
ncbi:MAG: M20 family metallopeptidase [Trueperaceae bacterium]|nr:M20 family metallopeptidase [Trueperaceae bacterium]MCO5173860.1 M20 family metallopeptidase [Trueperaceae bacterium]MCW5818974.1 M20 family metallopeptidase [Trueperaceae bacterium]